ncbi:PR-1-like protein [Xylaria intraflava]|nr:PR-1-like protein [Xylaria intraflava]
MAKTKSRSSIALLLQQLTVLLLLIGASSQRITRVTTITTITITAAPMAPSAAPQPTSKDAFTSAILNSTNFYRTTHSASPVVWNDTLASFATSYLKNNTACVFKHSGGPYGENIAMGYPNAAASIEGWGNEGANYDYDHPDFSESTGHFTQLVWKDTTDVGCGQALCGTNSWFFVCEYWPRGNILGHFQGEVGRPTNGAAVRLRAGWSSLITMGLFLRNLLF